MKYHVIETKCYPAKWKVESIQFPGMHNETYLYKRTLEEAKILCEKINKDLT